MKHSSFGSLIALSALAVAPSAALAQEPVGPTTPDTAAGAPLIAPQDAPSKVEDFATGETEPKPKVTRPRAERDAKAREVQADREQKDPAPSVDMPATDSEIADPGSLLVQAVPNFFIEDFNIPPFLLPIYQAAGSEYGVRWEVLAAINSIETNFGRNLNVSSAGALGWMQFMPATWAAYGVDANDDGVKDPMNPADAIFAAARYLKAAGADTDLPKAIWAYNHADWYVADVLDRARKIAALPESLVSSLAGLTQGVFPVDAADDEIDYDGRLEFDDEGRFDADGKKVPIGENAASPVEGENGRRSIEITVPAGARVVAVQDGVVEKVGQSERLGTFVRLRDAYGNRYTYGNLGAIQQKVPFPRPVDEDNGSHKHDEAVSAEQEAEIMAAAPGASAPAAAADPAPAADTGPRRVRLAAAVQEESLAQADAQTPRKVRLRARPALERAESKPTPTASKPRRLFANPARPEAYANGGRQQIDPAAAAPAPSAPSSPTGSLAQYFSIDYGLKPADVVLRDLTAGQSVIAGTVLGTAAAAPEGTPAGTGATSTIRFEIRPADKAAPRIDPRPILDGWRTLDRTAFYSARAKQAVRAGEADDSHASVGQILLMSKGQLQKRVLSDERISIYECGRRDIMAGQTDRRILALLAVLAEKDVRPVVTSLTCGHGYYTKSGNVSHHTTGTAVDIASAYGETITAGTQGKGSITDRAVREILKLQGNMRPAQIITLMTYEGQSNTLAMGDHDDHIHVGYRPVNEGGDGKEVQQLLKPGQWSDLVDQLSSLKLPTVSATPSEYSITVKKRNR